ncbi:hypothetical protein KX928_12615 [Roseobacter sp. YSTF-M11]|uniref:Uncharacterized protein n=1 Tax=Roseobacter insulae TaxID=2859783 RepID=A0A9X1K3H7_9RHOB|nr:hypothetical protein [Roseobacter insulae]MBW4708627.1 hypothetical protein [Roseobacter insulae]
MVALTKGRTTPRIEGDLRQGAVAATAVLFVGALLMRNAAGFITNGQTATGLVGVGVGHADVSNAGGADGDVNIEYRTGCYSFANSAGADEITAADIGAVAYAVDDQTVAKTDATATRSPAGVIEGLDARGVWVRLDEALTKAAAA